MVTLQADNKVDELAETNKLVGEALARELGEIVGDEGEVSQVGAPKAAHWVYSVPSPGVRYYVYD